MPLLAQDSETSAEEIKTMKEVEAELERVAKPQPSADDIKRLEDKIDDQSKQIDVLAQEIARLNLLLEGKTPAAVSTAPVEATEEAQEAPKAVAAESAPAGPVHIVAKGETLTAIAKRYKVTVPELLKMNKITDARRLQIGETLLLPPNAKLQESPSPQSSPQ